MGAFVLALAIDSSAQTQRITTEALELQIVDDPLSAHERAVQWRETATRTRDKVLELNAIRLLAWSSVRGDQAEGMKALIEEGLPLARAMGDVEAEAEFLTWQAAYLAAVGKLADAEKAYDVAMQFAEARQLEWTLARARALKASLLIGMSRPADAMALVVQAHSYFEANSRKLGMNFSYTLMGHAARMDPDKASASRKATEYYRLAAEVLDSGAHRHMLGSAYNNLASAHLAAGENVKAREAYYKAAVLFRGLKDRYYTASTEYRLAMLDMDEQQYESALPVLRRVNAVANEWGNLGLLFGTKVAEAKCLRMLGRLVEAAAALDEAERLSIKRSTTAVRISLEAERLALHEVRGEWKSALASAKRLAIAEAERAQDSRIGEAATIERRFADRFKEESQRRELELLESRRQSQLATLAAVAMFMLALATWLLLRSRRRAAEQHAQSEIALRALEHSRRVEVEQANERLESQVIARTAELEDERKRAEGLLKNILPDSVISQLKLSGKAEPRRHERVSVMFSDFVGFTSVSSTLPPDRLLAELGDIFGAFDAIAARHGLEKIKTIGDSYMSVAGLDGRLDHAQVCARAAQDMLRFVAERNATSAFKWQLRLGIHSGPVIAGVVGTSRFAFDVWGDTVNLASRMESVGTPGSITLSAYTYDLLKDEFSCEYRGKTEVKGKGMLDIYIIRSADAPTPG